jgi:hypothetical protein
MVVFTRHYKLVEPVKAWLAACKYDMIGRALVYELLNIIGLEKLAFLVVAKPGIFGIAPGTGKVAEVETNEQAVHARVIAFTLDGLKILVYGIYFSEILHYLG